MTVIKICGIKNMETAQAVNQCGADFLGLIFAPGRRQISPEQARFIVEGLHRQQSHPSVVGVFVNAEAGEVNRIADYCWLDYVQLSGHETTEYCRKILKPIIKVIHIDDTATVTSVMNEIENEQATPGLKDIIYVLDSGANGSFGGTGKTFDWQLAKNVATFFPVMIAGGLSADNVSQLIAEVNPWGVDVSSGVESGGKKDIAKIQKFIEAVRASA